MKHLGLVHVHFFCCALAFVLAAHPAWGGSISGTAVPLAVVHSSGAVWTVLGGVIHETGSLAGYSPADPANAEAAQSTPQSDPANEHTITVMFDYNFQTNPSCAEKPMLKTCIKQFVVYDISGQRFRLFSIPVPDGARGLVKGIKGESPKRIFLPGKHVIAVTAQNADGVESQVNAAKILVEVKSKTRDSISPAE